MKRFLKFTGFFYMFWSFLEVFLIFQTLTALDAQPDSPIMKDFYLQIAGFFLKLVVGSMAFLVERRRGFAIAGVVFAALDAVHSVYTFIAWNASKLSPIFYLVVDLTLLAFLLLVLSKWKKGGPAPFADPRRGRSVANAALGRNPANAGNVGNAGSGRNPANAPYPPVAPRTPDAPYPPVAPLASDAPYPSFASLTPESTYPPVRSAEQSEAE